MGARNPEAKFPQQTNTKRYSSKICSRNKNKRYQLTHQGIAIGVDGTLLDGQHRLLAIAKAGISVPIVIATNCDPSILLF